MSFQHCVYQLHAEFEAIKPNDAKNVQLRVQWYDLRGKVLEIARTKAGGRGELSSLLSNITNDYDEGLRL